MEKELDMEWLRTNRFDLTVSYMYRYILTEEILNALGNNAVNIHNSYLPWNRGADPNIWSFIVQTPRGVTLHYMNAGLDRAAKELFKNAFRYYSCWEGIRKTPTGQGSYHAVKDRMYFKEILYRGYDIKVSDFLEMLEHSPDTLQSKCIQKAGVQHKKR